MRFACWVKKGYKLTLRICNTYSFSAATIIKRIICIVIQSLGRFEQRPELSQATGLALVSSIFGKFLGVVCHCSPPRLDVPTFATSCLHVRHNSRDPSGGRWNCGREIKWIYIEYKMSSFIFPTTFVWKKFSFWQESSDIQMYISLHVKQILAKLNFLNIFSKKCSNINLLKPNDIYTSIYVVPQR